MPVIETVCNSTAHFVSSSEHDICELTKRVVAHSQPIWDQQERRWFKRHPYPALIELTPVNDDDLMPIDATITVVGRQLSLMGLDFYHNEPLPYRRVIISLEHGQDLWAEYVLALSWCRFIRAGWYSSGGRFTQVRRCPKSDGSLDNLQG